MEKASVVLSHLIPAIEQNIKVNEERFQKVKRIIASSLTTSFWNIKEAGIDPDILIHGILFGIPINFFDVFPEVAKFEYWKERDGKIEAIRSIIDEYWLRLKEYFAEHEYDLCDEVPDHYGWTVSRKCYFGFEGKGYLKSYYLVFFKVVILQKKQEAV